MTGASLVQDPPYHVHVLFHSSLESVPSVLLLPVSKTQAAQYTPVTRQEKYGVGKEFSEGKGKEKTPPFSTMSC